MGCVFTSAVHGVTHPAIRLRTERICFPQRPQLHARRG